MTQNLTEAFNGLLHEHLAGTLWPDTLSARIMQSRAVRDEWSMDGLCREALELEARNAKLVEALESITNFGGTFTGEDAREMWLIADEALQQLKETK